MKPLFEAGTMARALAGAATTLAMLASGSAGAAERQVYVSAHVGKNQSENWPLVRTDTAGGRSGGVVGLKHAFHGGLALGADAEKYRYELEYQHGRLGIESIARGPVSEAHSARGDYDALMVNGYRLWRLPASFVLSAGLGAGWSRVEIPRLVVDNGCICFPRATGDGWNYQARIGADYIFPPGHAVTLQWTRLRLPGASSGDALPRSEYGHRYVSAATLGYRFSFR